MYLLFGIIYNFRIHRVYTISDEQVKVDIWMFYSHNNAIIILNIMGDIFLYISILMISDFVLVIDKGIHLVDFDFGSRQYICFVKHVAAPIDIIDYHGTS